LERTQVRRVLIVVVMLALGGLGFVLGRSMVGQRQAEAPPPTDLEPDVTQRIKEFRRVKVKDGRKEWELTAQQAEFFTEQGEVAITGPKLAFYGGEGRDVEVKGREGRVFLTNGDVQRIELSGGIDVTVGDDLVPRFPARFTDPAQIAEQTRALAPPPPASADEILTPMGGTYYAREAPNLPLLVEVGQHFDAGQPLFIIEVMKMFNKISAPFSGTVVENLMEGKDGTVVAKGQRIFRIEPDERFEPESASDVAARRRQVTLGLL